MNPVFAQTIPYYSILYHAITTMPAQDHRKVALEGTLQGHLLQPPAQGSIIPA